MAWKTVGSRLTRFFGFPSHAARETFVKKVKALEVTHEHKLTVQRLGQRAAIVRCSKKNDITMKDHFMGAAVDSAANSIKGAKGSNSAKTNEILKEAAFGLGLFSPLMKGLQKVPGMAAASKSFTNGSFLPKMPGANRLGTWGRNKAINPYLRAPGASGMSPLQEIGKMGPGVTPAQIGEYIGKNVAPKFTGKPKTTMLADTASANLQAQLRNRAFPLGIKGRGDMRNLMAQLERSGQKDTHAYQALNKLYGNITRNRTLAGVGAGAAGFGTAAYLGREPDVSSSPFAGIANIPASLAEMAGAPSWANTMRQNPGTTTAVGGLSLAALLYMLMSNNRQN